MECGDGLACPTWPGGACRGPEPISPGLGFSELTVTLGAGSVVDTLLGSKEPSIQWKTRVHVLGEERDSKRVRAREDEIRRSPRVRALLSRRDQLGRPGTARAVYYKWHGVHWVLASLADIGYPEGDESLYPIRDRILEFWLKPSYLLEILGLADDRADLLAERLLHWQWPDGGWNCDRHPSADTSSFMETRLPMLGLAAYARTRKSGAVDEAVERASEVFLRRKLFKRATDGRIIHPDFTALHYPLYWHYDYLGGLLAMRQIGRIRDPRCADALDLLEGRRLPDGGWPAEKRHYKVRPRTMEANADYVDWGGTSRTRMNEWVTVDALAVLLSAGRLTI